MACGAAIYDVKKGSALIGTDPAADMQPTNVAEYINLKQRATVRLARRMRAGVDCTWTIAENGACGPTFRHGGLAAGFSAVFVSGPGFERGTLIHSSHADRESNMWGFAAAALAFLAECIEEVASVPALMPVSIQLIDATEDRYGGIECTPAPSSKPSAHQFEARAGRVSLEIIFGISAGPLQLLGRHVASRHVAGMRQACGRMRQACGRHMPTIRQR